MGYNSTKRGELYYVDDLSPGRVNHMHHAVSNKER